LPGLAHSKRYPSGESDDGSPQEEDLEVEEPKPARVGLDAGGSLAQPLSSVQPGEAAARRLPALRVVQGSPGGRGQLTVVAPTTKAGAAPPPVASLPVAVDAMGGDRAPAEIIAGARRAAEELGIPVVLVGPTDGSLGDTGGLEVLPAFEVIAMNDDPAQSVRTKRDSTLVRAAEAVRDGRASAMVSAGNTGATMASALLRMGRLPGVARPAIAALIPAVSGRPAVLVDAGANADCHPEWLVQFAQMGSAFMTGRFGIPAPKVALLSIGEEPTKGNQLAKEAHALLAAGVGVDFVGNLEGRDLLEGNVDVIVTDGFTGNVALKSLEGALRALFDVLGRVIDASPETRAAGSVLGPELLVYAQRLDPEETGGAMLLGVDGVCVISHGSSSARAILNAVRVAHEAATGDLVGSLREAVART
jgi:glycerol-3-phosphate acyltransferase PlsX